MAEAHTGARGVTRPQFTGKKPSRILYLGMGMAAVLKDVLDLVGIGSLPAIGTAVTACFAFFIWMLLSFDKSGGKKNKKMVQGMVLLFLSLIEAVGFGLNFMPIQTFSVTLLYILAKKAWKDEMRRLAQSQKTQARQQKREMAQTRRMEIEQQRRIREEQNTNLSTQYGSQSANNEKYRKIA